MRDTIPPLNWETLLTQFSAQLRAARFAVNSIDAYVRDTQHFFAWAQQKDPKLLPATLRYRHVAEYRQLLVSAGRRAATVNRRLGAIRQFSAWASTIGLTPYNIGLETPCLAMGARQAPVGLIPPEVRALLQAAKASSRGHGLRNVALVQLLLQTGVLLSEAAGITVGDIVFEGEVGHLYVRTAAPRELPLTRALCQSLQQYIAPRGDVTPDAAFFINERGDPLNKRGMQYIIQRLAIEAGITRLTVSPRTLRDTFALGYLRRHPRHLVELAQLLGHKTLSAVSLLQGSL